MKKDSIADSVSYTAFKLLGPLVRALPLEAAFFSGRLIGEILYAFDLKHKSLAYANIKTALGRHLPLKKLKAIAREFYRNFGQGLIEILLIPRIDRRYVDKYISIEGIENVRAAFAKGKGVVLLGVHAGSWELANIVSANLGYSFNMFVREQRLPRLEGLLNSYRTHNGCKLIRRKNQIGALIEALRNNEAIGMTADQGGRAGLLVDFFGKQASMPTGAIRLGLKYGAAILPVYYTRVRAAYSKIIVGPALTLKNTGDLDADLADNLTTVTGIFEKFIFSYPADYLWTYKIWKYGRKKNILILSDGKTGHLRQSQALARAAGEYLNAREISARVDTVEVKFKNKFFRLSPDTRKALAGLAPDVIISCGSSIARLNYALSRENLARSLVIMRPSFLSTRRFNLVIMPRHDRPPRRKNIVVTEGALNLITDEYLKEQGESLKKFIAESPRPADLRIGLLLGGDTKDFSLDKETMLEVIRQLKSVSETFSTDILVTTSRRTSGAIEELVRKEFKGYPNCRLLIIANEKNIPSAVGGILALSALAIVSPESISMVSEAASSGKYIVVFKSAIGKRHAQFVRNLADKKYIYFCEPVAIAPLAERLLKERPPVTRLKDSLVVARALERTL